MRDKLLSLLLLCLHSDSNAHSATAIDSRCEQCQWQENMHGKEKTLLSLVDAARTAHKYEHLNVHSTNISFPIALALSLFLGLSHSLLADQLYAMLNTGSGQSSTRLLLRSRRRDKHSGFPRFKRSHGWKQIVCMCFSIFLHYPSSAARESSRFESSLANRPSVVCCEFLESWILHFPSHMLQDQDHDLRRHTEGKLKLCCCCRGRCCCCCFYYYCCCF